MDGLTRNIAPHPISMGARTVLQALKHYHQSAVQPEHFMELMSRYNDLVYPGVHPIRPAVAAERARVLLEVGAVLAVAAPEAVRHLARLPLDVPVAGRRRRRRSDAAQRRAHRAAADGAPLAVLPARRAALPRPRSDHRLGSARRPGALRRATRRASRSTSTARWRSRRPSSATSSTIRRRGPSRPCRGAPRRARISSRAGTYRSSERSSASEARSDGSICRAWVNSPMARSSSPLCL